MVFFPRSSLREMHLHCGLPSGGARRTLHQSIKKQGRREHVKSKYLPKTREERRDLKLRSSSNDMASNENEFDLSQ